MEEASGSELNQIIGVGTKTDSHTGKQEPVYNFYPSYYRNVENAFMLYSVHKHFGVTIKDALAMPIDQWFSLEKAAKLLTMNKQPDHESQMLDVMKELLIARNTHED